MTDNKYNEVATKKMFEVLRDDSMDAATKAKAIGFCIDNGANPNAKVEDKDEIGYEYGYPALFLAEEEEVINVLVEKGADINARDNLGRTILMVHVENAVFPDTVEPWIERGVDINAKDKSGKTALMMAAHNGNYNISTLLIENGADVTAKCEDDYTALNYATFAMETANDLKGSEYYSEDDSEECENLVGMLYVKEMQQLKQKEAIIGKDKNKKGVDMSRIIGKER